MWWLVPHSNKNSSIQYVHLVMCYLQILQNTDTHTHTSLTFQATRRPAETCIKCVSQMTMRTHTLSKISTTTYAAEQDPLALKHSKLKFLNNLKERWTIYKIVQDKPLKNKTVIFRCPFKMFYFSFKTRL